MSEGTQHDPGTPSWADLGTTDAAAAKTFYGALFGWETEDTDAGPAGNYVLCRLEGQDVAGLYEQDSAMKERGVPPMWLVYITVEDVEAAASAATEAGGSVHAQPFDVGEAGRMALVQDPTGAMFALWQAGERPGAQRLHEPGTMDWFELTTNDPEKAGSFYEQVLGWAVEREEFSGTPYTTCRVGDEAVAGILPAESLPEGVPPNWSVYFAVEDCAAAIEKAKEGGGEVLFGPHEMPSVGQFAGLRDPQGAAFAIIQPVGPDDGDESEDGQDAEGEQSENQQSENQQSDGGQGEGQKPKPTPHKSESQSEESEGSGKSDDSKESEASGESGEADGEHEQDGQEKDEQEKDE